jgi:hypothetical protein
MTESFTIMIYFNNSLIKNVPYGVFMTTIDNLNLNDGIVNSFHITSFYF